MLLPLCYATLQSSAPQLVSNVMKALKEENNGGLYSKKFVSVIDRPDLQMYWNIVLEQTGDFDRSAGLKNSTT